MSYQGTLPFDESYSWTRFISTVEKAHKGATLTYYAFNRKITFYKVSKVKVRVTSMSMESLKGNVVYDNKQRFFEVEFMSSVLKDPNRHYHIYERSETDSKDWKRQIYRCIDPDCTHYTQAQWIIGKRVRCAQCKQSIVIEKDQVRTRLKSIKGLCCAKSKKAQTFQQAKTAITEVLALAEVEDVEVPPDLLLPEDSIIKGE